MKRSPPMIDMLPDGSFRTPPRPASSLPLSFKLGLGAAVVALLGLSLTVAALAVYVVSLLLPTIVVAGFVAWAAFRFRRWQVRRGVSPVPSPFRPRNPPGAQA